MSNEPTWARLAAAVLMRTISPMGPSLSTRSIGVLFAAFSAAVAVSAAGFGEVTQATKKSRDTVSTTKVPAQALKLEFAPSLLGSIEFAPTTQEVRPGEILMIESGKVVVAGITGEKRQILVNSRQLGLTEALELLDWRNLRGKDASRLLLTIGAPLPSRDLHTPVGGELWQIDSDGAERLVSAGVFQAKLSPDGERVLYVTSERSVGVQAADGQLLLEVTQGYDPHWKPDGSSIVLSRSRAGSRDDPNYPEGLHIATVDLATGRERSLTAGMDDGRPEFHPSADWVLFVSGGRTGLASFWRVSVRDGHVRQLTNLGATAVDDRFVPTPYQHTLWSTDGRWFLYDFKSGSREEVWGLDFGPNGDLRRAQRIATGLRPQWVENGTSVAVQQTVDGRSIMTAVRLPR